MLIKLILLNFLVMSSMLYAESKNSDKEIIQKHKANPDCIFDIIPLNTPVKESIARFLIKVPEKLEIDEVLYQVKNSGRIFEKHRAYQRINLIDGLEGKELRINVSKLPPGFYQLYVKVKDRGHKEHFFKTKFKDHAMFVIDNSLQVPAPDPVKNNVTLLGIDSDNDGIRDDVQRWINENFGNKPSELKLAFKQYAIAMQAALPTANDKQASIQTSLVALKAQRCITLIAREQNISIKEKNELREKVNMLYLNTKSRIEADLKSDENFHGQEITLLPKEEVCNF